MTEERRKEEFAQLLLRLHSDKTSKMYKCFCGNSLSLLMDLANGDSISLDDKRYLNDLIFGMDDKYDGYITEEWRKIIELYDKKEIT